MAKEKARMDVHRNAQILKEAWIRFFREVARPKACLACDGARVWWDGSRERTASIRLDDQTVHISGIPCRRARCANRDCGYRWCLLPPGLEPRRHFQACVVAAATQEYLFAKDATQEATAARHGCARRTLGRWLGWIAGLAEPSVIQERILEAQQEPILAPLRAVLDLARKACSQFQRKVLEKAACVLAHLEALAMALGLEPPALGSVLERLAPLGARRSTQGSPALPEFARRQGLGLSETLTM
jgi:hypothetical protein